MDKKLSLEERFNLAREGKTDTLNLWDIENVPSDFYSELETLGNIVHRKENRGRN